MKQKSSLDAIREACKVVGGQAAMSRNLGVSAPTVNQWTSGTRQIPAERCPEIEKATGGSLLVKIYVRMWTGSIFAELNYLSRGAGLTVSLRHRNHNHRDKG